MEDKKQEDTRYMVHGTRCTGHDTWFGDQKKGEKGKELENAVEDLFQSQLKDWELAGKNYAGLVNVVCKDIGFDGFKITVQYNPERIRSSGAKVDVKSIRERPCFLCPTNLPPEQKGIEYPVDYNMLVNPYPIFKRHLTIPDKWHVVQCIEGISETRMGDMLRLAEDLPGYVVLYNGPKSGASAPDHFHFQAGGKGMLPVESESKSFSRKKLLEKDESGSVYSMGDYLRKTLIYESNHADWIVRKFDDFLAVLYKMQLQPKDEEPMMNLIASYENKHWKLIVFPRRQHRPSQFYEEGEKQILFSPGVVDFGGTLIIPRKEDFERINRDLIEDMLSQLTFTDAMWSQLLSFLNF